MAVRTLARAPEAVFGLHLSNAEIGATVPVLAIILSLVLRQTIIPLATLRAAEKKMAVPAAPAAV